MGNLALDILAAHLVGDYILQTNEEAINKTSSNKHLATHVLKYALAFVPVSLASGRSVSCRRKLAFLVILAVLHAGTDFRRWASGEEWSPKPILVDQAMHAVQLAILSRILK